MFNARVELYRDGQFNYSLTFTWRDDAILWAGWYNRTHSKNCRAIIVWGVR